MSYIGNQSQTAYSSLVKQDITGNGGTSYTLSYPVSNENDILLYINNVKQEGGSGKAFTASGTTLTLSEAIANTDSCDVQYIGLAIQTVTPPDGSVSGAKIVSGFGLVASGIIMPFGGTSAPTGYLSCDGSAISRSTYSDLFSAIGTTWGTGNGSSTFNVPDLRAAFLRGTGSHGTSNMANGNDFSAPSVGTFENDQFQSHFHAFNRGESNARDASGTRVTHGNNGDAVTSGASVGLPTTDTDNSHGTPRYGDETRPFNASVLYVIKT